MAIFRIAVLIAVCMLAEAVLPYFVYGAPLGGVLLNLYVAIGVVSVLLELTHQQLTQDAARLAFERQLIDNVNRGQNVARWRARLLGALLVLQRITAWPAFEVGLHKLRFWQNGVRLRGNLAAAAAVTLFPYEISVSLFLALAALLTTVVALWTGHPTVYARAFLWLLIGSVAVRHIAALLGPVGMQERLRRALDSVVVNYAVLTLADLVCLLFAYNGVINWRGGVLLSEASLRSTYDELRAFKDVFGMWEQLPNSALGYIVAVSGLLWLLTLANSLLKVFSSSERTTDDKLRIAISCAMAGLESRARTALDGADPTTRQEFEFKGLGYAALGDFAAGAPYIAEYLRQLMIGRPPPSADYVMLEFIDPVASMPQSTELLDELIRFGAGNGMTDVFLSSISLDARFFGADPSEIAQRMERSGLRDAFPLGFIGFKWSADEEREVVAFYDALAAPEPGSLRAAWRCYAALLIPARRETSEATQGRIATWLEADLPEILADAKGAVPLHNHLLVAQLQRVQSYLAQPQLPLDAISAAIVSVEAMLGDDPLVAKLRRMAGAAATSKEQPVSTSPVMQSQPAVA